MECYTVQLVSQYVLGYLFPGDTDEGVYLFVNGRFFFFGDRGERLVLLRLMAVV